jgi:hypothetical protein
VPLGRERKRCDVERPRAEAVQHDYLARMHAFTVGCQHSFNFDRILEGRWILLSIHEMELERREETLMEE